MQQRQTFLIILAVLVSWIPILFNTSIIIPFIIYFIIAIIIFLKKSKLKWFTILLSSFFLIPLINFTKGTLNYINGKAYIEISGEPSYQFFNLSEKYRLWNSTKGYVVNGNEILSIDFNNLAVILWTKTFGFQKNVYHGPYPTYKNLEENISIRENELIEGEICDEKEYYSLILNNEKRKLKKNILFDLSTDNINCVSIKALYLYENKLLLIIVDSQVLLLLDTENNEIFARYYRE